MLIRITFPSFTGLRPKSDFLIAASITAWANDFGFETYFERQVKAHGKKNDILFLIIYNFEW